MAVSNGIYTVHWFMDMKYYNAIIIVSVWKYALTSKQRKCHRLRHLQLLYITSIYFPEHFQCASSKIS